MNLKDKLVEKLTIDSLSSRLNNEERNLWKWIMEYTIDNDSPFNRDSLEKDFGVNSQSLFDDLLRKKVIDDKIVDARPEETHVSYNDLNKSEKWATGL